VRSCAAAVVAAAIRSTTLRTAALIGIANMGGTLPLTIPTDERRYR
jgi:hypothetical protein